MKKATINIEITQDSSKQYQLHLFSEDLNLGLNTAYFDLPDFTIPEKDFAQWVKDSILGGIIDISEDLYSNYFNKKE